MFRYLKWNIGCKLLLILAVLSLTSEVFAFEGVNHSYATLLVIKSDYSIQLATKWITRDNKLNQPVQDLVADILWLSVNKKLVLEDDTIAWLAKALGASGSKRYLTILESQELQGYSEKVSRYLPGVIKQLKNGSSERYTPQSVDFEAISIQLQEIKTSTKALHTAENFRKLEDHMSIDEVYGIMGYPDIVRNERQIRRVDIRRGGASFNAGTDVLNASYMGLGDIHFIQTRQSKWKIKFVYYEYLTVFPDTFKKIFSTDDLASVTLSSDQSILLNSQDSTEIQSAASRLIKAKKYDLPTTDICALRLWKSRHELNPYMGNAMAYLAKYIGRSPQKKRYREFFIKLVNEIKEERFKNHAKRQLHDMRKKKDVIEQFSPGILGI